MTRADAIILDEAARLTRTDPRVIRRAMDNGLAVSLGTDAPGRALQFEKHEVAAWVNPGRLHELLGSRLRRAPSGMFLGDFPEPDTYRQKNSFILPFEGRWLVQDGGDMRAADGRIRNTHCYCEPCYRWACDFVIIHPDDIPKTSAGMTLNEMHRLRKRKGQPEGIPDVESSEPEDNPMTSFWKVLNEEVLEPRLSYLYEVNVVAPADGIFMTRMGNTYDPQFEKDVARLAREDLDDEMGFMVDHGNSEISQIAHVLGRTIEVRPGERVEQGQTLCKAGGRHRSLPHLHWAVRDSWADYLACGLPIRISGCSVYKSSDINHTDEGSCSKQKQGSFVPKANVFLQRGMVVENNWPNKALHRTPTSGAGEL